MKRRAESEAKIGVIGGSGLYQMEGLARPREVALETPFGPPSDSFVLGELEGVPVAFLPRHGRGHRVSPTEVPVRANIYALKLLGVERVISISAVGSLKDEVRPLDLVVPDQLIDRTRQRAGTFFGDGLVAHISFADPFCPDLSAALYKAAQEVGARVHQGGTYLVMEGPAFSTRAESFLYRTWGASVIGMTALPEAKLAREAEMCYATLACATDYDCWHESEEPVTVEMVVANLLKNVATSKAILRRVVPRLPQTRTCACPSALKDAIITDRGAVPRQTRERLAPLIAKYFS
ncbi:MAG: S-methyl-5'-thioadenosine phosphorylase [Chloroflexi bacterium]|nr:S-methyl-5'-thioadenosine phosphorylase [Chloroflexota bacterium]